MHLCFTITPMKRMSWNKLALCNWRSGFFIITINCATTKIIMKKTGIDVVKWDVKRCRFRALCYKSYLLFYPSWTFCIDTKDNIAHINLELWQRNILCICTMYCFGSLMYASIIEYNVVILCMSYYCEICWCNTGEHFECLWYSPLWRFMAIFKRYWSTMALY